MRVVVVVMDINASPDMDLYQRYRDVPFSKKIDILTNRIHTVCSHLQKNDGDAKWLITWSEYGVNDWDKTALPKHDKTSFKQKMQLLTSQYPQLAIIAGTIKSERSYHYRNGELVKKLREINKTYRNNKWIEWKDGIQNDGDQYKMHREFAATNVANLTVGMFAKIIRNTAYIFCNGKCIARHDKLAPFNEVEGKDEVFQIAKTRNAESYINIKFLDGQSIPVGVEICREHAIGVLKHYCKERNLQRPLLHLIISNCIHTTPDEFMGDYIVHADARCDVTCELMPDAKYQDVSLTCYKINAFDKSELTLVQQKSVSENLQSFCR